MKRIYQTLIIVVVFFSCGLQAQFFGEKGGFEPAEPEIKARIQYEKGRIVFDFKLEADYHITDLKNNFFTIETEKNDYLEIVAVQFPPGEPFGDEMVFKGHFEVPVLVRSLKKPENAVNLTFTVGFQVCQEQPQEMCFAPASQKIDLTIERMFGTLEGTTRDASKAGTDDKAGEESYSQWIERVIKEELQKGSLLLFALVFVAGFLTSLTPCVYPVIPIVMGYIGTRSGNRKLKGFYLSIFFVLGLALVYSVLGLIAAKTGAMMGISFQNPVVVIVIALIFIVMGLSLAGLFEIPVPSAISSKVQGSYKSEVIGAMIVGGVSGVIAAPCVGPVLVALLSWISQTGNMFLGFWLTFTFSMGMGIIFLLAGTFSGALSAMPKGGKWMEAVKYFFAVLLIGGGLYFLDAVLAVWLITLIWGVFLIAVSVFMGLFNPLRTGEARERIYRILTVLIFLLGALLFIRGVESKFFSTGLSTGPEAGAVETAASLPWNHDLAEARKIAAQEKRWLMIDTYADWCAACKELEKHTFAKPEVQRELADFVLVKLDFTARSAANEALRRSLNVIGMPTVIFYGPGGEEVRRFSGFKNKADFLNLLRSLPQ